MNAEDQISAKGDCPEEKNYRLLFGWLKWRPKGLQRLLSPKWALFFLCWAGAVQGRPFIHDILLIHSICKILTGGFSSQLDLNVNYYPHGGVVRTIDGEVTVRVR